jgi:hydrogenase expression/formation protein HypE
VTLPFLDDHVAMKHGAGGPAMRALIESVLQEGLDEGFEGVGLRAMDDGAALRLGDDWLVITTDSHVVKPRFFPGGDIGRLAIAGTVNDLAVMGATRVLGLTCALILEEGFPLEELRRVQASLRDTCREAGVPVVTGDTKVMGRGEVDGLVVNTTGVGLATRLVSDAGLAPGDRLLVSGTMADHGLAVMAVRNQLALEGELVSDVAPVLGLVRRVLAAGGEHVVAMTDPTRGGLATALHDMARKAGVGILLDEAAVPVREPVRAAADLLGIDPLHVANEGKIVVGVRPEAASAVLAAMREDPLGRDAAIIGTAVGGQRGRVVLDTGFGRRLLAEVDGELLPRIC